MKIIGVTGLDSTGKSEFCEILRKQGYQPLSFSDILRDYAQFLGKDLSRDNLIAIGNNLRNTFGPGVLGHMAVSIIKEKPGKYVIDSIRNPAEVEALKTIDNFLLFEMTYPEKFRLEKMKLRARLGDPQDMETLREFDAKQQSEDIHGVQLHKVAALADFRLVFQENQSMFATEISLMLNALKSKRLTWDQYFMGIMEAVAKRATCDRGKSGSVIAKDRQILSTGYVGAPAGLSHCDEGGHMYEDRVIDGKKSQHCIRTAHAEQNAINQAARNGMPIEGATIYCRMEPCRDCAKSIINAGIKRVVAQRRYHSAEQSREWLAAAGVELMVLRDDLQKY